MRHRIRFALSPVVSALPSRKFTAVLLTVALLAGALGAAVVWPGGGAARSTAHGRPTAWLPASARVVDPPAKPMTLEARRAQVAADETRPPSKSAAEMAADGKLARRTYPKAKPGPQAPTAPPKPPSSAAQVSQSPHTASAANAPVLPGCDADGFGFRTQPQYTAPGYPPATWYDAWNIPGSVTWGIKFDPGGYGDTEECLPYGIKMSVYRSSDNSLVGVYDSTANNTGLRGIYNCFWWQGPVTWTPWCFVYVVDLPHADSKASYYAQVAFEASSYVDPDGNPGYTWTASAGTPTFTVTSTPGIFPKMSGGACACHDQSSVLDPVDTATGIVTEQTTDLVSTGPGLPFQADRSYRSDAATTTGLLGKGWASRFEASLATDSATGNMTLTDDDQAQLVFTKNADGSFSAAQPARYTLAAVSGGFTVTALDHSVRTFDGTGRLTSLTDSTGKGLTLSYSGGVLSSVTDSAGRAAAFTMYPAGDPAAGLLKQIALPDGRLVSYAYQNRQLFAFTAADGAVTKYSYDAGGRLATITDPKNQLITQNTFDQATGRIQQQIDANGGKWQFAWKPNTVWTRPDSGESDVIDPQGGVWTDVYSGGVLLQHYDPYGKGPQRNYDSGLNISALSNGNGQQTYYTYFPDGDVKTRQDPGNSTAESWTYDAPGVIHTHTDARGGVWTYDHDPATLLLTDEIDPLTNKTAYTYNAAGQVLTVTTPRGTANNGALAAQYTTTNTYDASGNLMSVKDPLGNVTSYTYYPTGQVKSVTDPRGNVAGADPTRFSTTYTYDAAGRVLTTTDADGNLTQNHYDANGNRDWSKDGLGQQTLYTYDAHNRLTDTKDPSGAITHTDYYGSDKVKDTVDALGHVTSYTYDSSNRMHSLTTARGNLPTTDPNWADPKYYTTTYGYDDNGNQTSITDPLGDSVRTEYDALNRPWRVTDSVGAASSKPGDAVPAHQTVTKYDAAGNVVEVDSPTGDGTVIAVATTHYDADNRVDYITDPRGNVTGADPTKFQTHYGYDADGDRVWQSLPMGERAQWVYDADKHVVQTVDPRGDKGVGVPGDPAFTTTSVYDQAGYLIQTVTGLGETTQYGYDGAGNKTSMIDPRGFLQGSNPTDYQTTYGFDADRRQISVTLPATAAVPNPQPAVTKFDAAGNPVQVTDPAGGILKYGYDAAHHKISATTPRGNTTATPDPAYTTTYGFDADGNQTTVTDPPTPQVPQPKPTTTAYDAKGRARTVTDPLGYQTQADYNTLGQLDWMKDALGNVTKYAFDAAGNQNSVTSPRGTTTATPDPKYTTNSLFDVDGHLVSQISPLGEKNTLTYDNDGRLAAKTDPRGYAAGVTDPTLYQISYGYDAAGNQNSLTDPLKNTVSTLFDADNRKKTVTDGLNRTTTYAYWPNGALRSVSDPLNETTSYSYDQAGNLIGRADAGNHVTAYGYDALRKLRTVTDPLNRTTSFSYDPDGNAWVTTDGRGVTRTQSTDARGLVTGVTFSDGTPATSFTFDNDHRRVGITDAAGAKSAGYDADGRLLNQSVPGAAKPFAYFYDADGNVTSRQYPDGNTATFAFDADQHQITQTADGITTAYSYDPAGHFTGWSTPQSTASAAVSAVFGYDSVGRVSGITDTVAGRTTGSWQLTRDAAGQSTQAVVKHGAVDVTVGYKYDPAGRLTEACPTGTGATCSSPTGAVPGVVYTYDKVGNRLTQAVSVANGPATTSTYHYDAGDQLSSVDTSQGTIGYSYDAAGNQTGSTAPAGYTGQSAVGRTYDANEQVSSLTLANGTKVSYTYDADGNRVTDTWANGLNGASQQMWDPNGTLPMLAVRSDASGSRDYRYTPQGSGQQQSTGANAETFLLTDYQGSVTDAVDAAGVPTGIGPADYDPFGATSSDVSALGSGLLGYDSQLVDPDGVYDNRARAYDPAAGRFTSRDPLSATVGDPYVSAYVYANDKPTTLSDPSGRRPADDTNGNFYVYDPPFGFWYDGGSKLQHDEVLSWAWQQETLIHGPGNVYADLNGYHGFASGQMKYQTYWSSGAHPDLVAQNVQTPTGEGYAIWDVKPASANGRSHALSVDKLYGYLIGLEQETGKPVVLGDPVIPETRFYGPDAWGAQGVMLMFNGEDWHKFGIPEPKLTPKARIKGGPADIADLADTKGLIYYKLLRRSKKGDYEDIYPSADLRIDAVAAWAEMGAVPVGCAATKLKLFNMFPWNSDPGAAVDDPSIPLGIASIVTGGVAGIGRSVVADGVAGGAAIATGTAGVVGDAASPMVDSGVDDLIARIMQEADNKKLAGVG